MKTDRMSIWDLARERGHSRRDFLQFCTWIAAAAGIHSSGLAQVVKAMESQPRLPVLWFHFQECTCCSESFIRSPNPILSDIIFDMISLDYSETLQAAAGKQAEQALHEVMQNNKGNYLMAVEGSLPTGDDGIYCCIGGRTSVDIATEAAQGAKAIIAWGNCACYGCVQAAKPNPTGAAPAHEILSGAGKSIINVPGCPPIPRVMAGTLVHLLAFDRIPPLDNKGRPKAFYSRSVHDDCDRLPHYEVGRFVESFDDENARLGYCLYKLGCRGPETYNSCGLLGWNGGVGSHVAAGHGCLGCSEEHFWDKGSFYEQVATAGISIGSAAKTTGIVVGAAAAAGLAGHAITKSIRKKLSDPQQDQKRDRSKDTGKGK
jgi:hydrogenase small subunit